MQITARSDYAVRAALELAVAYPERLTIERIVAEQEMPRKFVEAILSQLRRSGIVQTQRGCAGGYSLARSPKEISVGDIIRIGNWVLQEACAQMRRWREQGLPPLNVSINLSAPQLQDPTLLDTLAGSLARHAVPPRGRHPARRCRTGRWSG